MSTNNNSVKAWFARLAEAREREKAAEQEVAAVRSLKAEMESARNAARQAFDAADGAFNSAMGLEELKAAELDRSAAEADIRRADSLLAKLGERMENATEALKLAKMRVNGIEGRDIPDAIKDEAMAALGKNRDFLRLLAASAMRGEPFVKLETYGSEAVEKMRDAVWSEIYEGAR